MRWTSWNSRLRRRKLFLPLTGVIWRPVLKDDATLRINHEAFKGIQLRPRRLVDVSKIDMKVDIFGTTWETPVFIYPVGSQKAFYPAEGEIATAKAARAKHHLQILSTQTSTPVEDVAQALGTPPWYQLYMPLTWDATEKLVHRVEAAGCPALVWTIDLLGGRSTETAERYRRIDTRDCTNCHSTARGGQMAGASQCSRASRRDSIRPKPPGTTLIG